MRRITPFSALTAPQQSAAINMMRDVMLGRAREFGEMRPTDWPVRIAAKLRWIVNRYGNVFGPKEAWGRVEVSQ